MPDNPSPDGNTAIHVLTAQGMAVARRLEAAFGARIYAPLSLSDSAHTSCGNIHRFSRLQDSLRECFHVHCCHIFITAAGIAVRCIAPLIQNKAVDPAVLVIDQRGRFVISLLSGHLGGGNAMAAKAAAVLGATAVITTATDVEDLPAMDVLARDRGLAIANLAAVKTVSAALLAGKRVALYDPGNFLGISGSRWQGLFEGSTEGLRQLMGSSKLPGRMSFADTGVEEQAAVADEAPTAGVIVTEWELFRSPTALDAPPDIPANCLVLHPPLLIAGVGCRRNASAKKIIRHIREVFLTTGLSLSSLAGLASIEAKRDEAGLLEAAKLLELPVLFFSPSDLSSYPVSSFSPKAQEIFGVKGVCEPAALAAAGSGATLVVPKTASGEVTVAVARIAERKKESAFP